MKKLYRKSAVHPTPSVVSEHLLSFLPAAILALTVTLSPADREVLAYLISCSSVNFSSNQRKPAQKTAAVSGSKGGGDDHAACFNCNCFRCYISYWAKWDSSPNRQLIHEVIDAFEERLVKKEKNKERRKGKSAKVCILNEPKCSEASCDPNAAAKDSGGLEEEEYFPVEEEEGFEKGTVRRFVSFLGERLWSVWG